MHVYMYYDARLISVHLQLDIHAVYTVDVFVAVWYFCVGFVSLSHVICHSGKHNVSASGYVRTLCVSSLLVFFLKDGLKMRERDRQTDRDTEKQDTVKQTHTHGERSYI
jgi:hypothetical protein